MDIIRRLKKKSVIVFFIPLAFNTFFIISLLEANTGGSDESFEAKIIEEELSREFGKDFYHPNYLSKFKIKAKKSKQKKCS